MKIYYELHNLIVCGKNNIKLKTTKCENVTCKKYMRFIKENDIVSSEKFLYGC
jgi:hypothetical protein